MLRLSFTDSASRYDRISKRDARAMWDSGQSVYVIAHKMRPGFPFSMGMMMGRDNAGSWTFQDACNNFMYYNCTHETGYYPAFYRVTERQKVQVA